MCLSSGMNNKVVYQKLPASQEKKAAATNGSASKPHTS
jgi:hypothetical protein